jgi:Fe-S cluster assembly protein SufB
MKRAEVKENGLIEWVGASLGSKITMSYPTSVLTEQGARAEHLSLSLADRGQEIDSGGSAILLEKNTSANIVAKSICLNGGISNYRGRAKIVKGARNAKVSVKCDGLILDDRSQTKTFPAMEVGESESLALHEAKTGKISEEEMIYLMSRGLNEEQAMSLIINGFIEPVVKEMPIEYAVEINKIMELYVERQ